MNNRKDDIFGPETKVPIFRTLEFDVVNLKIRKREILNFKG